MIQDKNSDLLHRGNTRGNTSGATRDSRPGKHRGKHSAQHVPDTRIFLIRHGQPVQHSGKIFLGQSDIPLSEQGKGEAETAGDRLLSLGARPKRIYTSDLSRAMETADIIAEKLGGVPVIPDILFREMAMGTWDGELVEDIRKKFPEEFEKRGDDLRNYRTPGGENFYDLSSRVTREFHRIFAEDFRGFKAQRNDTDSGGLALQGNGSGGLGDSSGGFNGGHGDVSGGFDGGPGGLCDGSGGFDGGPGDLVIVAHFGVLVTLTEELLVDVPGADRNFATGSVTIIDVPEWLWA
ncbi:MAG: histidine phosphatase family protein [Clostridiales bacterium]|nr:histidine phosphatase family protein [Clostridiales bacterium]